jgi:thiol-disulfide isomerase/thioredoxin
METDTTIRNLVANDIIKETSEGFVLDSRFRERVRNLKEDIESDGFNPAESSIPDLETHCTAELERALGNDPELLARFETLAKHLSELKFRDILGILLVLDTLAYPPTETDGAPKSFVSLPADRLDKFLPFVSYGVVYVWQDDCDPCDVMVDEFGNLSAEERENALFLAVYGPKWGEHLADKYDVAGAPTTLFIVDGDVDARLTGAHPAEVLATELETVQERANSDVM